MPGNDGSAAVVIAVTIVIVIVAIVEVVAVVRRRAGARRERDAAQHLAEARSADGAEARVGRQRGRGQVPRCK